MSTPTIGVPRVNIYTSIAELTMLTIAELVLFEWISPFPCRIGVGCMYGFTIVDYFKNTTIHVASTFTETNMDQGHLSRMQSIRKSFRQSLKRLNVRRSLRGGQSTQRSFRPALVRSGSTRPSMKNRTALSGGVGASPGASNEPTPMPPRRDSIRSITFTAPSHLARECVLTVEPESGDK